MCAVGNGLALEAQLEAAGGQIADQGQSKNRGKTVFQMEKAPFVMPFALHGVLF